MAKYTKKWQKDFEKRYSNVIKELRNLENEYKEMVDTNPDEWELRYLTPNDNVITFDRVEGSPTIYYNEKTEDTEESIEVQFGTGVGFFYFRMENFKDLIDTRNSLIEQLDKFARPVEEKPKKVVDECQEYSDVSDEEWEQMEDKEWTVRVTRPCTQSWTLTVMAKNSCEAEKKARMGEPEEDVRHDENDDFDNYGPEDFECID